MTESQQNALITSGSSILGQTISAGAQANLNRKQRKWNEKMYQRQREDSLADWTMLNKYNHPSAQMARLRESGLNPNLVYGNGADAQSSPVRSSDAPSWNPKAPEFDLGAAAQSGLGAYYDTQIKQAQTDNLQSQNTVLEQEALLKAAQVLNTNAQTANTLTGTDNIAFDLDLKKQLRSISAQAAEANLNKTLADTRFTLDQNERAAAMQAPNLMTAAENILNMRAIRAKTYDERNQIRAQIKNLQQDSELKQLDINLRKKGINPQDPIYMRVLGQLLENAGESKTWKWMKDYKGFLSPEGRKQLKELF